MWLITKPGKLESKSINLDNVVSFGLRVNEFKCTENNVSKFYIRFRYNGESYEDVFLDAQDIDEAQTCYNLLLKDIASSFAIDSLIIYGLRYKEGD